MAECTVMIKKVNIPQMDVLKQTNKKPKVGEDWHVGADLGGTVV